MNLNELMIHIREKPESFLQDDCIFQLRAFLRGFILAKNIAANGVCDDHKLFERFNEYVRSQYGIDSTEVISVEEVIHDAEQNKSYERYIELWFNYVNH
mgnify:CR=1 FL=1